MANQTTGCPTKINPGYVHKRYNTTWMSLFRQDEVANEIYSKWLKFQDTIDYDVFAKRSEKAYDLMYKMEPEVKQEFIDAVKNAASQVAKESEGAKGINQGYQVRQVSDYLKYSGNWDKELIDNVKYIEELFTNNGYTSYKIFQAMNSKTGLSDIYNNIGSSLKYPFLLQDGVNIRNIDDWLVNFGKSRGMKDKAANRFKNDMLGTPLLTGKRGKRIGAMKSMYSFLKYSPITAPVSGAMLLLNNSLLGTSLYLSKKRGIEGILKSDAVDYLLKQEDFLKSERRAGDVFQNRYDQDGKNFFNRMRDNVFNKLPSGRFRDNLKAIMVGGVHNVRDLSAENTIKRLVIGEALSKNGITDSNVNLFLKNLQDGNISSDFLLKLRGDAGLARRTYWTMGNISSINRNRFSRMWYINTLQSYVINRADDVWSGITKAFKDYRTGKRRLWGDFAEYLKTENPELKSLLNNMLLAGKIGIYINAMTEGRSDENEKTNTMKYVINLSDYISSLDTAFYYRLLTSPVRGVDNYFQYTKATGQPEKMVEGISAGFLTFLSETMRSLFREGKVLNVLSDGAISYLKTGDVDFTSAVMETDIDKIVNGMGRFSLLPGFDSYGQKGIESKDDMIGRILFNYPEFNEAVKETQRLRDIGQIETILNDKSRVFSNLIASLPLIGSFYKGTDRSITGQYSEAAWKMMQKEINENPIMQKIWDGEFPDEILDNENITNHLYSELTSHSYYGKKIGKDGKIISSTYGLTPMEEEVFTKNIADKLGISLDQFEVMLKSNRDKAYLTKMIAAAEANEPGSSKIVLSYLANQALHDTKTNLFGKGYKNTDIDPGVETELRKNIIKEYYPFMSFADKTSRYKVAREYLAEYKPEIYSNLATDSKLNGFVNTLGFTDLVFWNEARQGNVDASYVKNIFNVATKYIQDDELRTKLVSNSLDTISDLANATPSQKQLMKVGVLSANIDFYNKIKSDPKTSILYEDDIKKFENTIWGTNQFINDVGIADGMEKGMDDYSKKQYYGGNNKERNQSPYYGKNNKVLQDLDDKIQKYYNPAQDGAIKHTLQPNKTTRKPISDPREYYLYRKIYDAVYKATSEDLTKQSGRKYPAHFIESLKFSKPAYRKTRRYESPKLKFSKTRKQPISTKVKGGLPGG